MVGYEWRCLVCNRANDSSTNECEHCGYTAGGCAHEVDAREVLLKEYGVENRIICPICDHNKFAANFTKKPKDYYYNGMQSRIILFEVLSINMSCKKCNFTRVIECDVPIFRKLYRWIAKKDIESEFLKRL